MCLQIHLIHYEMSTQTRDWLRDALPLCWVCMHAHTVQYTRSLMQSSMSAICSISSLPLTRGLHSSTFQLNLSRF